jgi:hypothetical protein
MKATSLLCILLGFIFFAQCQETKTDENGCVWNYKCCVFTDVEGEVSCARMCEAEISCPTKSPEPEDQSREEVVGEAAVIQPAFATFSIKPDHICLSGFRLDSNGVCRRLLGAPKDRKPALE